MRKTHNPNADEQGIVSYIRAGRSCTTTCTVFDIGEQQYDAICRKHSLTRPVTRSSKPRKPTNLCSKAHCLRQVEGYGLCKAHLPRVETEPGDKPPPVKESPSAVAKRVWGNQLTERDGDYFLENKRIGFNTLMQRTNRKLIEWGMVPVTGNSAWDCH